MEKIKTGLASFGMSGETFHAPLLHTSEYFEIKSIVERNKESSREKYPYTKLVRSFDELCKDPEIELIVVNTPDHLHFEMCKKALLAGKNIVVEKPFTQTSEQAYELMKMAQENKLVLSVFQNRRWDGDFLTVKKVIEEGLLGQLVDYEAHFDRYKNYIQPDTWKEDCGSGTGILFNLGTHLIDQTFVLFGQPQAISADIRTQRPDGKIDDNFELLLKYDNLKVILKASYLVREPGPKYILHGTEGSFLKWGTDPQEEALKQGQLPDDANWGKEDKSKWGILNTNCKGLHVQGHIETFPGNYQAYYNGIYEAIRYNTLPEVKPELSASVIKIIEAAFQSQNERREISLI